MSAPATADHRPLRNCYKCGREIGPDESICAICNRAGMATPSASQYHGTIVVAIVAGVALLAVAASLSMRGVGPFRVDEVRFQLSAQQSVVATARVTNQGSKSGRAKCVLTARDASGGTLGSSTSSVSREVSAGGSVLVSGEIPGVSTQPATVSVSCQ